MWHVRKKNNLTFAAQVEHVLKTLEKPIIQFNGINVKKLLLTSSIKK